MPSPRTAHAWRGRVRRCRPAQRTSPGAWCDRASSARPAHRPGRLCRVERDTQLRLLAAALQWISSAPYRPRAAATEAFSTAALPGGGHAARRAGRGAQGRDRYFREFAAVSAEVAAAGSVLRLGRTVDDHGPKSRVTRSRAGRRRLAAASRRRCGTGPLRPPTRSRAPCLRFSTGDRLVGCPSCSNSVSATSPSSARRWDIFLPC
jgi:hypothetical protein